MSCLNIRVKYIAVYESIKQSTFK